MTTKSERNISIGLMVRQDERDRLADYARAKGFPSLCAALRSTLPDVFREPVKEGRPLGYSPKRRVG